MRGYILRTARRVLLLVAAVLALGVGLGRAGAEQLPPDQAARMVLDGARRALNEGNFPFAIERFREFLGQHGGHPEAPAARYGLGVALLEGPQKDYRAAAEALQQAAQAGLPDRPLALYYLGAAVRGQGDQALAEAEAKPPNEAAPLRASAAARFGEAGGHFASAASAFAGRVKAPPAADAPLPPDLEWATRARCDQADMLLRAGKAKEALAAASALLGDAALARSRYRPLALYHLGYAQFSLKDYLAAGKALSQLAPFDQPFGPHARYLLGRVHHLAGERPEAAAQYAAIVAAHEAPRKAAREALKNPGSLKPEQRAEMEALVNRPPPDYVVRAAFYGALVLAEQTRYAEAMTGLAAFARQNPKSPLAPEAQLRQGFCLLQLNNYAEAVKVLQPLADQPSLADRALWWLARAQVAGADPKNAAAYEQVLRGAMDALRRAADRAAELAKADPEAKVRRGDILLELADTQQLARQYKEAAATYQQVLAENAAPDRAEEALQRQATALQLAGQYRESDEVCRRFQEKYLKSTLLPAVLFRMAENTYLTAVAAAKDPNLPNREAELKRLFGEALARYERLLRMFPDFPYAAQARLAVAASHVALGRSAEAVAALSAIPEADRAGDLAAASYLLADCLLRTLPTEAEDAIQAARLVEQAEAAAKHLGAFLGGQDKSPQAPDALLKLSYCHQRIGAVLADTQERRQAFSLAREACERFLQQFKDHPLRPAAALERARCLVLLGDPGTAMGELRKFQADPLRGSPVAPLAMARLAALLRAQGQPQEAVKVLAECRQQTEAALAADPARKEWLALLQYEHAVALEESGNPSEARPMFEALAKPLAGRPEAANAVWRVCRCRRQELAAQVAAAREMLVRPGAKPEETAAARQAVEEGMRGLRQAADALRPQADALAKAMPKSEAHVRALHEIALCLRTIGEAEVEAVRQRLQQEALAKVLAKFPKEGASDSPPPALAPPDVPTAAVPVQPSEKAARDQYAVVLSAAPDTTPAMQARLELAEMHARRGETDAALDRLEEALEKAPPPDLALRLRLRLAALLLAKGDAARAEALAQPMVQEASRSASAEARYLAGEAAIARKDWAKAIEYLVPLRDQETLRQVPGVSDRGLLRLAHAYGQAGQWEPSRQACEALVGRFPQSPWVEEARYGMGLALESQKRFDEAVNHYVQVTRRTAAEAAARAQLRIGLCRLQQQRPAEALKALLVVPYTYGYPDVSAEAWCEAARAHAELKQPAEAAAIWQRVVQEHPGTPWAELARQRLTEAKGGS